MQARLEDHRRLLAAQESEADERERLRMEIRAQLELRVRYARSAESKLRALNIPLEYDPVTRLPNISKAVRSSLRFYHPDRYQVRCAFVWVAGSILNSLLMVGHPGKSCPRWELACAHSEV